MYVPIKRRTHPRSMSAQTKPNARTVAPVNPPLAVRQALMSGRVNRIVFGMNECGRALKVAAAL